MMNMFSISNSVFGKFKSPTGQLVTNDYNLLAHRRFKEHEAGWTVFKAGQAIAKLSFIRIDPPAYLFRFTMVGDDVTQKRFFEHSAMRNPDPELIFHNQADPNIAVVDGNFL